MFLSSFKMLMLFRSLVLSIMLIFILALDKSCTPSGVFQNNDG